MPEELMPAEEDQEPEPCPNCGKVGGDCEELAARQKELNTINVKLGKQQQEKIKEAREIRRQMRKNYQESKKLRMTVLKRRRDLIRSKIEEAEQLAMQNAVQNALQNAQQQNAEAGSADAFQTD